MSEQNEKFVDVLLQFVRTAENQERRINEHIKDEVDRLEGKISNIRKIKLLGVEVSEDCLVKLLLIVLIAFLVMDKKQQNTLIEHFDSRDHVQEN